MEKLEMEELILLKEFEILQARLSLIRAKKEYVRKINLSEQKQVIIAPEEEILQAKAILEQTATSKEATNPLKVVDLPKIQTGVQTSVTLVKPSDLNLRPNGGIQIPKKTEGQTSAVPIGYKAPKAYYVVFNGPNSGIYTSWNVAELAVKGVPGIKHKKYASFDEAQAAARVFTSANFKAPLELICSADALKPSYSGILKKESSSKIRIGTIPGQQQNMLFTVTDEDTYDLNYSGFNYLYRIGRNASEKEFAEEHFFTTDKKNVSYFNFYPNACPEMVYEAYQYGLLQQVYPSSNLLELSRFPKEIRDAVKVFRKKCLQNADKEIYLKVSSTIIFWEEINEPAVQPYYYMQVGSIKEKIYNPSQAMEAKLEEKDLQELAEVKLINLINKIFSITRDDKLKVNLVTTNCLITSYFHKGLSSEDWEKIKAFQDQITLYCALGRHKESFCQKKMKELKKFDIIKKCQICDPAIIKMDKALTEDPTNKELQVADKTAGKTKVEEK